MKTSLAASFLRVVEPVRASEEIARQMAQAIDSGMFQLGETLPGERQLAQIFGVSRGPVREAMASLEALGYIAVRPGRGATVELGSAGNDSDVRHRFESRRDLLVEHFEVHAALFAEACALAAKRGQAEEVAVLQHVLERQEQAGARNDKADLFYIDRDFTCVIAAMAHNRALESLIIESSGYTRNCRITLFALPTANRAAKSIAEHRRIVDRIKRGDAVMAAQAGRDHVLSALHDWLRVLSVGASAEDGSSAGSEEDVRRVVGGARDQ